MAASEEQLRRNAELKLWIENRIGELQEEIDRLREALAVIDSVLRASSFRPAAELSTAKEPQRQPAPSISSSFSPSSPSSPSTLGQQQARSSQRERASEEEEQEDELAVGGPIPEIRELRRDRGGETIAVAEVTRQRLKIEPVAEVTLKAETPPFKSFLLGKILSGMKSTDEDSVNKGTLKKGEELKYTINEKGGKIASLVVENYREKERLAEILNTASWTFSRMLEK
jgi:hypothetical protein